METEEFVKHVVNETNAKFSEVKLEMSQMNTKLDRLIEFRSEIKASAKSTSMWVSSIIGVVVAFAAEIVKYLMKH